MNKTEMIKLRIDEDMLAWLKSKPAGMSATIRRLIANEMKIDEYIREQIPQAVKHVQNNNS